MWCVVCGGCVWWWWVGWWWWWWCGKVGGVARWVGGGLQLAWNLANLSMIQNNDVWSPETYTNGLINSTSAQTICNFTSQFRVCRCYGPFICWGTSNTVVSHESRRFILPKIRLFLKGLSQLTTHETSHYNDILMGAMASQNTSFTIVYSAVYSGEDQIIYQCSESLAFVRGIHRWPINSPHKGPVTRNMFPFDDVIMRKLSIIGRMLGNHRSSVDFPYKGPATREAFWCHCVMMQA